MIYHPFWTPKVLHKFLFLPYYSDVSHKTSKLDSNFELEFEDVKDVKFGYKKFWRYKTVVGLFVLLVKILSTPTDSSE